jgi:hypothetical protein
MARADRSFTLAIVALTATTLFAKDKNPYFHLGTFVSSIVVSDGTTSNNIRCGDREFGSTVCSGGVQTNGMTVYEIKVPDGVFRLLTYRQASDASQRRIFHSEPLHFKAEQPNPLDLLKSGDKVLFRIESHRKIGGTETDIYIPFADNPAKEAKFVATFYSADVPAAPNRPSDNVRAMCEAHKLTPEQEKRLCGAAKQ